MSKSKISVLFFLAALLASNQLFAQRKCGTVEYMNQLGNTESKEVLENWIFKKQLESPKTGQQSFSTDGVTIYQIPVVVHVVHNGEAEGVGTNISESQILSQIAVLNEDFRKLNADSVNIPAAFKSLYSDIGFEFVMAKRNPNNQTTNGITRTQGSKTLWGMADDVALKSQNYWPSEDYLNFWIAPLSASFLGWAQFPQSDILDGLDPPYNATTDGIVITYNAFGSIDKDPAANLQSRFNLGRTTTHEIGHFFGLRHIWGDGGCGIDDYVTDTPIAEDSHLACPSLGGVTVTCSTQDMYMNFMDYVDDDCMNIFSTGQKDRMLIIMENSPRRLSLTTSLGLFPPNSEDLAITAFISPTAGICGNLLTPSIEVKNFGVTQITTTNISLYLNNVLVQNQDFNFILNINQSVELTFNAINLAEFGNLIFEAKIETVNGVPDDFENNDSLIINSLRAESVLELEEDFSSQNPQWTVRTNQEVSALNYEQAIAHSIDNKAAVFNYYKADGKTDGYISPKLNVGTTPKTLLFDYAYASRNELNDELAVYISTDCGNTFPSQLFKLAGSALATSESPVAFYPSEAGDWVHMQIDLSNYANEEVIFSFVGKSAGGNRILFDNIKVVDNTYNDIALIGLNSPAIICSNGNEIDLTVENKGTEPLVELIIIEEIGDIISTISYPQLNLLPGKRINVSLPVPENTFAENIVVSLQQLDDNNANNSFTQTIILPNTTTKIPLREKFEYEKTPENWALFGTKENGNKGWSQHNNRLEFIAENSIAKGLKEQIVLPPLDLTGLNSASMHFDFAYAYDGLNEEVLRVKVSNNCGNTYETLYLAGGEELATGFSTTPWLPNAASDWKNIYVDLTDFAGNENVQIVIELVSAKGNNAFITNVELYASNIIEPLNLEENTITAYPNPSTNGTINISFSLNKAQPARLLIYNAQGMFIYDISLDIALNQTLEISTINLKNGMYFARVVSNEVDISRSFMVSK